MATLRTADGTELQLSVWPAAGRGWVAVVHGYGEHSGRYEALARWLSARGWSVASCDLRGHGRSPGRRGHVRSFDDYLHDVAALYAFVAHQAGGQPVFLLGHSLGGLIALRYVQETGAELAGLVLSAPFLELALPTPRWKLILAPALSQLWPTFSTPSGLRGELASRDPEVAAAYDRDPLVFRRATARWFAAVLKAQREALAQAPKLGLPLLVLHGEADAVASPHASRQLVAQAGSADKTLHVYGGFRHEVLNELGKERAWEDLASWLAAHRAGLNQGAWAPADGGS